MQGSAFLCLSYHGDRKFLVLFIQFILLLSISALTGHGGIAPGRDFELRAVPSCGFNQLTSNSKRDRQLETRLDQFFDAVDRRNSRDSVRTC